MSNALLVGITSGTCYFLTAAIASAATILVPDDFATIQEAVFSAEDKDIILVSPGVHAGFLEEGVVDMLGKEISLLSTDGPQRTFIDGAFTRRGISCTSGETSNTIIDGFTIMNGVAFEGGGILCSGSSPTIRNCVFEECSASFGAAVRCTTVSSPVFEDCQFVGNFADFCGGAIACAFDSEITITRCDIAFNFAKSFGGGLFMELGCSANVSDSVITQNSTEFEGGGIWSSGSSGSFINTEITNNFALNSAGGVYSESSSILFVGVVLSGNLADNEGGALVALQSEIDLVSSVLAGNASFGKTKSSIIVDSESVVFVEETAFFGEVIDGTISIGRCFEQFTNASEIHFVSQLHTGAFQTIQSAVNAASDGALITVMRGVYTDSGQEVVDLLGKQIFLFGTGNVDSVVIDGEGARRGVVCQNGEPITTQIRGFTIRNCVTPGSENIGAGIYCDASDATISCCKIINNVADRAGGGIGSENSGSQLVFDCLISENNVTSFLGGGGYYNEGGAPIIRFCIVSSNIAPDGGGIYFENCSSLSIENNDITFNQTNSELGGEGGGVYLRGCLGASTIANCTIDENVAFIQGGGIFVRSMSLTVDECSVLENTADKGGGISCDGIFGPSSGEVVLKATIVEDNFAFLHGGGVYVTDGVSLVAQADRFLFDFTSISKNIALAGGGIFATEASPVSLEHVSVVLNKAVGVNDDVDGGGGIKCTNKAELTAFDCFIDSNESGANGGGVHLNDASAIIISSLDDPDRDTEISNNKGTSGGGIRAVSSSLELLRVTLSENSATEFGGALDLQSCTDTTVQSCLFVENTASNGGAIGVFNMAQVFEDLSILNNEAFGSGGGIHASDSSLGFLNVDVNSNTSEINGGGMALRGCNTVMSGVTVFGNDAQGDGGGVHIKEGTNFISASEIGDSDITFNEAVNGAGICYVGTGLAETHSIKPGTLITGNVASRSGGGVHVENLTLDVSECVIGANEALGIIGGDGGGFAIVGAKVTCANSDFISNRTEQRGGAISAANSEVAFDTCSISTNTAAFVGGSIGGGAFLDLTEASFTDCLFFNNVAQVIGGGLAAINSTIDCTDCNFNLNQAVDGSGGGLFIETTSISITGGLIDENSCVGDGGGMDFVSSSEECFIEDVIFDTNSANRGGAIASLSDSNPEITGCTFTDNFALTDGGAILSFEGLYTATDCSFSDNLALAANGRGGAICNILSDDSPEIENCTFEFNSAALGFGGAMAFDNEVSGSVVTGCTFTENGAARGGGMWANASSPSITDCVIESNSASEVGAVQSGGGGMHIRNEADPIVTNTTFLGNLAAARGGGLFIDDDSDPQFFNCVIRKNDADLSDLDSGGGFLSRDKSFPMFTNCTICFNNPNQRTGIFVDGGGNVITDCGCPGACPADFNGDGIIDGGDIGILLSFWGFEGGKCSFDLNGDGIIDGGDLGLMLGLFGPCGAG